MSRKTSLSGPVLYNMHSRKRSSNHSSHYPYIINKSGQMSLIDIHTPIPEVMDTIFSTNVLQPHIFHWQPFSIRLDPPLRISTTISLKDSCSLYPNLHPTRFHFTKWKQILFLLPLQIKLLLRTSIPSSVLLIRGKRDITQEGRE